MQEILVLPSKKLRKKVAPLEKSDFTNANRETFTLLSNSMLGIVRRMHAVGLSSNQVGVDLRMFVAVLNGKPYVMLNPVITSLTTIGYMSKEGCLSVPGYTDTVERIAHIEVEWRGVDGAHLHEEFMEFNASVIQHETDHLDGILFIDNLSSIKRARALKKVEFWKRRNNSKGRSSYKVQETV